MQNDEIAKVLDEIADMLEIGGENFFRVRAYRNAARAIHDTPAQLADLPRDEFRKLPGIGMDLAGKLATLLHTGELPLHRELLRRFPTGLLELRNVGALGPKRIKLLADRLNIRNREDLRRAVEAGLLRTIRGFGPKMEERIQNSLAHEAPSTSRRFPYHEAALIESSLVTHMRKCEEVERIEVAGSYRRRRETVGDLDLLVVAMSPERVMRQFLAFPDVARTLGSGETRAGVVLRNGLQVDFRVVPEKSYGAALVYFTGSKAHCVHLRRMAQMQGLLLNEYGLFRDDDALAGETEEQVYEALGLRWIPPELREERGEIEAAAAGHLPTLVTRSELRGDLHTHSSYTDGRASIEQMAQRARGCGLEYFAVTDHSLRLTMVNGLDPERLHEQWSEIEQIGAHLDGITILRGIEVDILEDGSLDLPNEVLAELDWVVASVHYKLEQDPLEMTRRLVRAIRNPNVDVIGHPSGRLINHRQSSSFDWGEVLRVAHEEGCALEINSQPDRLDLTDTACMAAKQAGVKLVISSDAHHPRDFDVLDYGVNQARRGWIEAADVLNTRSLSQLRRQRR